MKQKEYPAGGILLCPVKINPAGRARQPGQHGSPLYRKPPLLLQSGNDLTETDTGFFFDDTQTQLLVDDAVNGFHTCRVRNEDFKTAVNEAGFVEILGHSVPGSKQGDLPDAGSFQPVGCGIRDMDNGNRDLCLNLRSYLVHGVGADDDEVRAGGFQLYSRVSEDFSASVPLAVCLAGFDFSKFDAVEDDPGRVQAAKTFTDLFVDDPVVGNGAFPAHSAD